MAFVQFEKKMEAQGEEYPEDAEGKESPLEGQQE